MYANTGFGFYRNFGVLSGSIWTDLGLGKTDGAANGDHNKYTETFRYLYQNLALTPQLFLRNQVFDLGLAYRADCVFYQFSHWSIHNGAPGDSEFSGQKGVAMVSSLGVILVAGWDPFKFEAQIGVASGPGGASIGSPDNFRTSFVLASLGILYRLDDAAKRLGHTGKSKQNGSTKGFN